MELKKAVVVGAGPMGRAWARTVIAHEGCELAGWADLDPGKVFDAIEQGEMTAVPVDSDFRSLVRDLGPDFVVDATVPEAHCEVVTTALGMGVPVIGEKPMADSMDAARKMVDAADESGKLYMVSQSRRYNPWLVMFREAIGHVGDLGAVYADFFVGPRFDGFRVEMASPLLLDMAIHTFDAARALTGLDGASVYCEESNPDWSWYEGDASCEALFEMDGGVRFSYRGSWCAEGHPTSWEANWRAVGSGGTAVWDGYEAVSLAQPTESEGTLLRPCEESRVTFEGDPGATGIMGALAEFLEALESGTAPQGECHDNINSLAMVFAALRSSREGRRVKLSEV